MKEIFLVVGATGKVGKQVAMALRARGHAVRATSRDPGGAEARVPVQGIEWVPLDFDRPESFSATLRGVSGVFLQARPGDPHPDASLIPFLDEALRAGTRRVVLMTALNVDRAEELGLRRVERWLIGSGLEHTILRPNWFMQNFTEGFIGQGIRTGGGIYLPAGEAEVSFVDTADIAAVAVRALTEQGHQGQEYDLTGGEALSHAQVAELITRLGCREVPYVALTDDQARDALTRMGWPQGPVDFMLGLFGLMRQGYAARVDPTLGRLLGRAPTDFQTFARTHRDAWC